MLFLHWSSFSGGVWGCTWGVCTCVCQKTETQSVSCHMCTCLASCCVYIVSLSYSLLSIHICTHTYSHAHMHADESIGRASGRPRGDRVSSQLFWNRHQGLCKGSSTTVCTENATCPKSTKSRHSDFLVSRGTHSNCNFDLIWMCTEEFEFLDLVDFEGLTFSVDSVMFSQLFWI